MYFSPKPVNMPDKILYCPIVLASVCSGKGARAPGHPFQSTALLLKEKEDPPLMEGSLSMNRTNNQIIFLDMLYLSIFLL
jgi:hypothetical protein